MLPDRERHWPWVMAGYIVLFAVIAAATAYVYDMVAAPNRPVVIRLAVVMIVCVLLVRIRGHFRGDPRWDRPSSFEEALARQRVAPKLDPAFVKLREELASAHQSRSYFDKALWPRLRALAQSRGTAAITIPQERSWVGRGPSFRAIAGLIDRIAGRGAES